MARRRSKAGTTLGIAGLAPKARVDRGQSRIAAPIQEAVLAAKRGTRFEVPYELSGKTVRLVVDPHAARVVGVEDEAGNSLGQATALDAIANITRKRRKPEPAAGPT